jgi:hypothetical protein
MPITSLFRHSPDEVSKGREAYAGQLSVTSEASRSFVASTSGANQVFAPFSNIHGIVHLARAYPC